MKNKKLRLKNINEKQKYYNDKWKTKDGKKKGKMKMENKNEKQKC